MAKKVQHFLQNISVKGIVANGSLGATGHALKTDGTNTYWGPADDLAAVWGNITGTLSNQTDLQAALDLKLNSSAYTAADVLAKLITVDGAGSGLDADLLDGVQLSALAQLSGATFTGLVSAAGLAVTADSNQALTIGRYSVGAPIAYITAGSTATALVFQAPNGSATLELTNTSRSIKSTSGGNIAVFTDTGLAVTGTLSATVAITENGNQVWHTGNDGSGSGLDADLLDGLNSNAFGQVAAQQTWSARQTLDNAGLLFTGTSAYFGISSTGLYRSSVDGLVIVGTGTTNDLLIANKTGGTVMTVPTGSLTPNFAAGITVTGAITSTTATLTNSSGDGTLTVNGPGAPFILNSTNSNAWKIVLRDAGATRGGIGANATGPTLIEPAGTTIAQVSSTGFSVTGTTTTSGVTYSRKGFRAVGHYTNTDADAEGPGLELGYDGTRAWVLGYNRTTPGYVGLRLQGTDMIYRDAVGTDRATFTSSGLAVTGALSATGLLTSAGYRDASTSTTRLENTGAVLPSGTTGVGLELIGNGTGISYITSYNRSTAVYTPVVLRGSTVTLHADGVDRAVASSTGIAVTGRLTTTSSTAGLEALIAEGPSGAGIIIDSSGAGLNVIDGSTTRVRTIAGTTIGEFTSTGLAVTGTTSGSGYAHFGYGDSQAVLYLGQTATGRTSAIVFRHDVTESVLNCSTAGLLSWGGNGLTVTGTLSCSGNTSLGDATGDIHTFYGNASFNVAAAGGVTITTSGASSLLTFQALNTTYGSITQTSGAMSIAGINGATVDVSVTGTTRGSFNSTGLAVTGNMTWSGGTISSYSNDGASVYHTIANAAAGYNVIIGSNTRGVFSGNGLAVSGNLSATGNMLVGATSQYGRLTVHNDTNGNVDTWTRNENAGASAAAGVVLNASGNSWRIACGSTAKNGNALTFGLDATAEVEKMRLTSTGLVVTGSATTTRLTLTKDAYGTTSYGDNIQYGDAPTWAAWGDNVLSSWSYNGNFFWGTSNGGTERMRLNSTGLTVVEKVLAKAAVFGGQAEALRLADSTPFISFYNSAQITRFGYLQHGGTNIDFVNEVSNGNIGITATGASGAVNIVANGATRGSFSGTGLAVTGAISATGNIAAGDRLKTTAGSFVAPSAGEAQLSSTSVAGAVLTGSGSSYDIVITNKTGGDVMRVPTGTTVADFVGGLTTAGGYELTGATSTGFDFGADNGLARSGSELWLNTTSVGYLGYAGSNRLSWNISGVTISSALVVSSTATFNSTAAFNGHVTLGDSIADVITVNAYFKSSSSGFIFNNAADTINNVIISDAGDTTVHGFVKSKSPTGGVGYTTGAGGAVTQLTSKATGVTLNTICGRITLHNENLSAGAVRTFTLTNSNITTTDVIIVNIASGHTTQQYKVWVDGVSAGSCQISIKSDNGGSLSEAVVLNFAVIKAVA